MGRVEVEFGDHLAGGDAVAHCLDEHDPRGRVDRVFGRRPASAEQHRGLTHRPSLEFLDEAGSLGPHGLEPRRPR